MEYKDIERVNQEMNTTDIKGKDYVEVNQRIKAFRKLYPEGTIETEMLSNENGVCVFRARVYSSPYKYTNTTIDGVITTDVQHQGVLLGTGTAYEKEDSSFINKTSYIENCETSAVGRALGMCGFGIDVSVASAEEVQNAINNQAPTEEDAKNWKFTFGKYKGETMEDILSDDEQYVMWYINNKAKEYDKQCYELLTGEKLPTEQEQDDRINLVNELNQVELEFDIPHEKTLEVYKVNSTNEMTVFQLTDAIAKIKSSRGDK